MELKEITPEAVVDLQAECAGILLVDVREVDEFTQLRAPFAVNHPLSELERGSAASLAARVGSQAVYLICRSGQRSARAARLLQAHGVEDVVNVVGGMIAWEKAGLPTAKL
jgi:rhodanese-related sulfurtransferase